MDSQAGLRGVVAGRDLLLLDFDGPVTPFFADGRSAEIAESVRTALVRAGVRLTDPLLRSGDPFDFVRAVGHILPTYAANIVTDQLDQGEMEAAEAASPTDGITELLDACQSTGRAVVIASNNSPASIDYYVRKHHLAVDAIVGRTSDFVHRLKPCPAIVEAALKKGNRHPGASFLFGDSVTDILAAKSAGVMAIGHGKNPRRAQELRDAGADAVVPTPRTLAVSMTPATWGNP